MICKINHHYGFAEFGVDVGGPPTYSPRGASPLPEPMPFRSINGRKVDSLRAILGRLGNDPDPAWDARALADLMNILLSRIAVLEAEEAFTLFHHDSTKRAA